MQDFFEETDPLSDVQYEYQQVEINLLMSFWKELKTEMDLHWWDEEQSLRYILAASLAALRNQRQSETLTQDERVLRTAIKKVHTEQVHLYGRYAEVMHYASELKMTAISQDVQLKACKTQLEVLRKVNAELLAGLMNKR